MNNCNKKSLPFEGEDIIRSILNNPDINVDDIICDELTKGRIRTIYVQLRYGKKNARDVAEYYDLPVQLVRDIGSGKIFKSITSESYSDPKK